MWQFATKFSKKSLSKLWLLLNENILTTGCYKVSAVAWELCMMRVFISDWDTIRAILETTLERVSVCVWDLVLCKGIFRSFNRPVRSISLVKNPICNIFDWGIHAWLDTVLLDNTSDLLKYH